MTSQPNLIEKLIEALAALEHEQWLSWAQAVAHEVSPERRKRWESCMVPYDELSEPMKELDREFVRLQLPILRAFANEVLQEAVPEEKIDKLGAHWEVMNNYRGWNACRAATLERGREILG